MNETEAVADELRVAAIHETGHAVIAKRFGVETIVALWSNRPSGIGDWRVAGRLLLARKPLATEAKRLIGLAGAVAGLYADEAGMDAIGIADAIECGVSTLSDSDARMVGDWTLADVELCLALVKGGWPEIEAAADWAANGFVESGSLFWTGDVNDVTV